MGKNNENIPRHIALIMDGNRRWAKKRLLPVALGHDRGVKRIDDVVEVALEQGVEFITLYAFSTENWQRDTKEVDHLLNIIRKFYDKKFQQLLDNEVKVQILGSRTNVPEDILILFDQMEAKSAACDKLTLNIAFNYGGKQEIVDAVNNLLKEEVREITINDLEANLYTKNQPPVDLVIRTSGEQRISNFLLWQIAYAEFIFTETLWPDFKKVEFKEALELYAKRNRRFGGK